MVIGAPRSGTSWAANWLTSDHSLCLHDPLFKHRYDELDYLAENHERPLGVSCTGLWAFHAWLNDHPAPKVVLHRPVPQVNASLRRIGLPEIVDIEESLSQIRTNAYHLTWDSLFNPVQANCICNAFGLPFDHERHQFLQELEVGPRYQALVPDTEKIRGMLKELHG